MRTQLACCYSEAGTSGSSDCCTMTVYCKPVACPDGNSLLRMLRLFRLPAPNKRFASPLFQKIQRLEEEPLDLWGGVTALNETETTE